MMDFTSGNEIDGRCAFSGAVAVDAVAAEALDFESDFEGLPVRVESDIVTAPFLVSLSDIILWS